MTVPSDLSDVVLWTLKTAGFLIAETAAWIIVVLCLGFWLFGKTKGESDYRLNLERLRRNASDGARLESSVEKIMRFETPAEHSAVSILLSAKLPRSARRNPA